MSSPEDTSAGPVIRDRRRIDPVTGQVREPDRSPDSGPAGSADETSAAGPGTRAESVRTGTGKHANAGTAGHARATPAGGRPVTGKGAAGSRADDAAASDATGEKAAVTQLAERTADLQRIQAEYANYRKRVERDRLAVREQALASVLAELLPALDDIGRARDHGELSGGFKSVADSIESAVAKLGLVSYGESGEPFDPVIHEALTHSYSDKVSEATCMQVLQPGYKIGDRILRPARVAVAGPGSDPSSAPEGNQDGAGTGRATGDTTATAAGESPHGAPDSNG
jgi:molecular chaperone GrpE